MAAGSSSHASRAHGSEELSRNFSRAVDEVGARSAMVVMVPESIRVEEEEAAEEEEEEEEEQEESEVGSKLPREEEEEELSIRGLGFDGTPTEVV